MPKAPSESKKLKADKTAKKSDKQKKKNAVTEAKNKNVVPVINAKESKTERKAGFAIQIASYDKRSKAINEIENLRNYHAYIDDTSIDGKQFFRVRIGTFSSKEKAAETLNELQGNSRYSESYIVKQ
jgi:cell division septation protein DedD